MKKVIIGILVLIPIIIVLTVGMVSSVVSTLAHIAVESIELDEESIRIGLSDDVVDLNDYLTVKVLPDRATDKGYVWSIEQLNFLDSEYEEKYNEYLLKEEAYRDELTQYRAEYVKYQAEYEEWVHNKQYDPDFDEPAPVEPTAPTEPVKVPKAAVLYDYNKRGELTEVEAGTSGLVGIYAYCYFYATVQAETMKARCLVVVGSDEVEAVALSAEKTTLNVGEAVKTDVTFTPLDSVVTSMRFVSDNPSVASVDANGVITAVSVPEDGAATVNITAFAQKHNGEGEIASQPLTVTVGAGPSFYGASFAVDRDTFTLAEAGIADCASNSGCAVSPDGTVTMTEDVATITTSAGAVITIERCKPDDFVIVNQDVFGYRQDDADSFVLEVGGIPLALSVAWKSAFADEGPPEASWSSDNEAVATVGPDGVVTATGSGFVTITAAIGEKRRAIQLSVAAKVSSLVLAIDDQSLAVGLARETVFASQRYADATATQLTPNGFYVGILMPSAPADADESEQFYKAFDFTVDRPELAYFEGNRLVFRPSAITEESVIKVTVKAKYPKYAGLPKYTTKAFSIKVVPGVAVTNYRELRAAAGTEPENAMNICLESNIAVENAPNSNYAEDVEIRSDVYGNNFMIHAKKGQYAGQRVGNSVGEVITSRCMFAIHASGVKISNIILRANETGAEISNAEDNVGMKGYGIRGEGGYGDEHLTDIEIRFSIVENCSTAIGQFGSDMLLDGCIIRNTSGTSLYSKTSLEADGRAEYSVLKINNCVISNVIGTIMNVEYSNYSGAGKDHEAAIAAGKNSKFIQTGFLDVYNWQRLDLLQMLPPDSMDSSLIDLANWAVQEVLLKDPNVQKFRLNYGGNTYFHLGLMSMGSGKDNGGFSLQPSYLETEIEDKRFVQLLTTELDMPLFQELPAIRLWCYTNEVTDIVPGRSYSVNAKLIDRLHQKPDAGPSTEDIPQEDKV